jgi:hypothetical protein
MARFITRTSVTSGGGGTDANPHGYANATVTYRSADYTTEDSSDLIHNDALDLATWTWISNDGAGGNGCWEVQLGVNSSVGEGPESQSGYGPKWWPGGGLVADQAPILCVSQCFKFSQKYLDVAWTGELDKSKFLDIHGFNSAGNASDINTRQLMQMCVVNGSDPPSFGPGTSFPLGIYLACTNGGAGGRWCYDGTNTPVDLRNYPDQWIWVCWLGDCSSGGQRSIIYVKPQGGSLMTSVVRTATDQCAFAGTFGFNNRGWACPPAYNSQFPAYWQENRHIYTPKPSIRVDRLRCANGWITPPF